MPHALSNRPGLLWLSCARWQTQATTAPKLASLLALRMLPAYEGGFGIKLAYSPV